MQDDDSAPNNPEMTVTELSGALKRTVEDRFGFVRVRGEISGWRGPHSSGHCYFSIKDQGAKIDAVIWKGVFGRMKVRPEEGLEVVATGKVTTYPGKSSYQIIVESIAPAGVGALLAQLEARRAKLAAEGLFDAGRKRKIPYLPVVPRLLRARSGPACGRPAARRLGIPGQPGPAGSAGARLRAGRAAGGSHAPPLRP